LCFVNRETDVLVGSKAGALELFGCYEGIFMLVLCVWLMFPNARAFDGNDIDSE
jgi:hypothetical protein